KKLRLQQLREQLPSPPDGKKTFVNMSFGTSPERATGPMMADILDAPEGSKLHDEATKILGHAPRRDEPDAAGVRRVNEEDVTRLKKEMVYPALKRAMEAPDLKANLGEARQALETELAEGRKAGILVFAAAGNEGERAEKTGDIEMSAVTHAAVKGLINVGA